jgi:hypothetical protein
MELLIALILINGLHLPWWWNIAAVVVFCAAKVFKLLLGEFFSIV